MDRLHNESGPLLGKPNLQGVSPGYWQAPIILFLTY
jgi:hypothetical protein